VEESCDGRNERVRQGAEEVRQGGKGKGKEETQLVIHCAKLLHSRTYYLTNFVRFIVSRVTH